MDLFIITNNNDYEKNYKHKNYFGCHSSGSIIIEMRVSEMVIRITMPRSFIAF